eukprot:TRINITY_DN51343_c0_g1_i1.p1 TRINITY_DN51343_c0_g1~~TRINITY_DN51343_c0_g1_i1.p1  ORF type:complete len:862 (+),score=179.37 TRINITY_DN51343_c0_g1_i1:231-2816(+)
MVVSTMSPLSTAAFGVLGTRSLSSVRSSPSLARNQSRGMLSRAGWHVLKEGEMLDPSPPVNLDAEGARLVSEVASLWCRKYSYFVKSSGAREGGYHFECVFSLPTVETPVPPVVVRTRFALVAPTNASASGRGSPCKGSSDALMTPRLFFSFEEGDLRHAWRLVRDEKGLLQLTFGQQAMSLKEGYFEEYIQKYIVEKEVARDRGISLVTPFESTRLPKPQPECSEYSDEASTNDLAESEHTISMSGSVRIACGRSCDLDLDAEAVDVQMAQALKAALKQAGLACDRVAPPSSLHELLENVFDAADEDGTGKLPHYEVASLLGATLSGLGLRTWDIQTLTMAAEEDSEGLITCTAFLETAPDLVVELRRRRLNFCTFDLEDNEVDPEAARFCFGPELGATAESITQLFQQRAIDFPEESKHTVTRPLQLPRKSLTTRSSMLRRPTSLIGDQRPVSKEETVLSGLKRRACLECLQAVPSCLSPQEVARLMQMLPEDEDVIYIGNIFERLEELRVGSMMNCLVESDPATLRKHLVLVFRHAGMTDRGTLKLWEIRQALLQANQICLSRMQIHLLECLAWGSTDNTGDVDIADFLGTLSVVVPHMFNPEAFVKTAERLQLEAVEAQRLRENAELADLSTSRATTVNNEDTEKVQDVEVDHETVEKTLIQVFTLGDDLKRSPPSLPPQNIFAMLRSSDQQIANCQLADYEICGFLAEMVLDARGEVVYGEHVKRVVPMIFEMRRNQLLSMYLQEGAFNTLGFPKPDLAALEALFPLLVPRPLTPTESAVQSEATVTVSRRLTSKRRSTIRIVDEERGSTRFQRNLRVSANGKGIGGISGLSEDIVPGRGYERRRMRLSELAPESV